MKACLLVGACVAAVAAVAAVVLRPHVEEALAFLKDPASVFSDGSAVNPEAYRALLLNNSEALESLGQQNATWRSIVETGTLDEFQAFLRDMRATSVATSAFARNPDGSAVNPKAFREQWRADAARMEALEASDPYMHWVVATQDDDDVFQDMLRGEESKRRGEEKFVNADVMATMTMLTEDGEEKELHQVQPRQTEEEVGSAAMPDYMKCAACGGVAHQFTSAIAATLAAREAGTISNAGTKPEPLAAELLDALQDGVCRNMSLWTHEYGVQPGVRGTNVLVGPGIVQDDQFPPEDALLQTQHGNLWGRRLADLCQQIVVDHDELDLAHAVARDEDLRPTLCDVAGVCRPKKAPAVPAPKKKARKKPKKAPAAAAAAAAASA